MAKASTSIEAKLAPLHAQFDAEMERHKAEVASIQAEMIKVARGDVGSVIEKPSRTKTVKEATESPDEVAGKREVSPEQTATLLAALQARLSRKLDHYNRPAGVNITEVRKALEANPAALWSLWNMEQTGGEPDVVAVEDGAFLFADCSAESPSGRRNCVYDKEAEQYARNFNGNAVDMAEEFGVEIWTPDFYQERQKTGKFDCHTVSWLKTDEATRTFGYALRGDRDGDLVRVFRVDAHYHYVYRAWRGLLRVPKA